MGRKAQFLMEKVWGGVQREDPEGGREEGWGFKGGVRLVGGWPRRTNSHGKLRRCYGGSVHHPIMEQIPLIPVWISSEKKNSALESCRDER